MRTPALGNEEGVAKEAGAGLDEMEFEVEFDEVGPDGGAAIPVSEALVC